MENEHWKRENMKNLLVISSYPPKGKTHDKHVVGIASYAKNTLVALKSAMSFRTREKLAITVLAERLNGQNEYHEKGVWVKRIWQRNSPLAFFLLLKEISFNHKDTKTVLLEFEHAMFGEKFTLAPLPLFVLLLRLMNKKVVIVFHQVIDDISEFSGHLNIPPNSFSTDILNLSVKLFYITLLRCISKAIVFDEILRARLGQYGDIEKIIVIPHGVEEFKNVPSKREAREKLGIPKNRFVLLSFGFIAWYKGTDWLVDTFRQMRKMRKSSKNKRVMLIIAGGPNPNHLHKGYYKRYITAIRRECARNDILLTGFIPEEKIPLYFRACDVVILPYRTLMSSSGPLSLAFSFKKPFLVSEKLNKIFDTKDLKELLQKSKLDEKKLTFSLNDKLWKKIQDLKNNLSLQKEVKSLTASLSRLRSWVRIGSLYYDELFG